MVIPNTSDDVDEVISPRFFFLSQLNSVYGLSSELMTKRLRIMNNGKFWMTLAIVLTAFCIVSCGGGDDDGTSGNGGSNKGNGSNTNAVVAVTGTVTEITDNSAQITGTVYIENIIINYSTIEYGVQLSTNEGFTSPTYSPASTLTNNVFTVTATELTPETKYWYRTYVKVQNTSYYGQTLSFTTEKALSQNLTCSDSNHPHMIDLGLPSGTMWACCNVGASKPEDYGGYFAWGETVTSNLYYNYSYDYCYYDWSVGDYGYENIGSDIAGDKYDAAFIWCGSDWCMPSATQMQELLDNTTSVWTVQDGVNGRTFTGNNGGMIFMPAAASRQNSLRPSVGESGAYWSSTIAGINTSSFACCLKFNANDVSVITSTYSVNWRYFGFSIRPVHTK